MEECLRQSKCETIYKNLSSSLDSKVKDLVKSRR